MHLIKQESAIIKKQRIQIFFKRNIITVFAGKIVEFTLYTNLLIEFVSISAPGSYILPRSYVFFNIALPRVNSCVGSRGAKRSMVYLASARSTHHTSKISFQP